MLFDHWPTDTDQILWACISVDPTLVFSAGSIAQCLPQLKTDTVLEFIPFSYIISYPIPSGSSQSPSTFPILNPSPHGSSHPRPICSEFSLVVPHSHGIHLYYIPITVTCVSNPFSHSITKCVPSSTVLPCLLHCSLLCRSLVPAACYKVFNCTVLCSFLTVHKVALLCINQDSCFINDVFILGISHKVAGSNKPVK